MTIVVMIMIVMTTLNLVLIPAEETERVLASTRGAKLVRSPQLAALRRLSEQLTPAVEVASSALTEQARRNALARAAFLKEVALLDASTVAEQAGSVAKNHRETASRWLREGRVFTIASRGRQLFAAFQFDDDGHPRPVIAKVVAALRPKGLDGWPLALWWTTPHDELDYQRPIDLIDKGSPRVVEAAEIDARTFG